MKKHKKLILILALIGALGSTLSAATTTIKGWNDCPKGKHCASPKCGKYVDTNKNKLCDRGENQPSTVKASNSLNDNSSSSNAGCSSCVGCGACAGITGTK